MRQVAIIGGGITGLAAAHHLHEIGGAAITLLEGSGRTGGVISTRQRDGFTLEAGPDSLITEKPWGVDLIQRLGLGDHLVGTSATHRRSFVVRRGRLRPTPEGFHLLAPARLWPLAVSGIFGPLGLARMAGDLLLPARSGDDDESLGQFVRRRLGRQALERLAQPMISAIYGADPDRLSLMATFPRFRRMEQESGSLIRAMRQGQRQAARQRASGARYGLFASLDGGLQLLTDTLAARLPSGTIRTGVVVDSVRRGSGGRWQLAWPGGSESFDAVIVALPAPLASRVLAVHDADLARKLSFINYGAAATVSLAYRLEDVAHKLDGFGFVVPAAEGLSILGCTFTHVKYEGRAPAGYALLRAFHGPASRQLADDDVAEATRRDLGRLLGLRVAPLFTEMHRWQAAMPHYGVGHLDLVTEIEERVADYPGLALAGNAYRGLGVPDCVRSGEAAAAAIMG